MANRKNTEMALMVRKYVGKEKMTPTQAALTISDIIKKKITRSNINYYILAYGIAKRKSRNFEPKLTK